MPGRATNDPANYIALGKQTAKDVEATTFYYLKHLDGSGFEVDFDVGAERTGGDGQEIGFTYRSLVKADGNLVSYAWPEWVGRALAAVLGQDTPSLVSNPLTDHTLVPVASLPYFTVEQKWADINERNTNCKVTSVDIEFEAGKPFKVTAAIVGGGTVWIPTAVLTPAREAGDPIMYPLSSIALTGMATGLKVTKGKISIKRGVDDGIQTVGLSREDVVELNQDFSLDLTCKYEDSLNYKNALFNGGTTVISDLATMGISIFQALGSQSMRIDMPLLEISGFKVNKLDPMGRTMYADVAAQTVKNATFPLWARVRNIATAGF
jgi:hypothetical protein